MSASIRTCQHRLPDLLGPALRVVFCGSAAGTRSAAAGAYYAGPQNRFWQVLHVTGVTPECLRADEFHRLRDYGVGLTDMAKHYAGADGGLRTDDDDPSAVIAKIQEFRPAVLAFNGKRAAKVFFGAPVTYGRQARRLGDTALWVLPSTSAAARRWWDEEPWHALAAFINVPARCRGPR